METVWRVLTRKKLLEDGAAVRSELGRVLDTKDLTFLGVGSTLGVGVYVLAGHVAKDVAGPSVVLSFLIATVASVFAGLCYAEFGARTPRAGSAYIYSYVSVGEFVAFVIGWNLILEYVIGSASVARGLSLYLDTLINNTLKDAFIDVAPMGNIPFMSPYFDFFAFGISLVLAAALAFGLKESSLVNNIFTVINLLVVVFVVIAGSVHADTQNWKLNVTNTTFEGDGGFFPFGVEGMIKGAATCFYGFVGFDCIATTGEEVKNPKRAIPLAIVISLFIIFLAYFCTSTVLTLMVPYYAQDANAPLPHAFTTVGMDWAKWVVAIGGIFGLCASLFGAMFPLPRIIYAMASDNIIFSFLGRVSQKFKTPVVGTLLAGVLTGLMAGLFDLKQLVNMMSLGTLMAYTIVAASVLLLRYEKERNTIYQPLLTSDTDESDNYTENRGFDQNESEHELITDAPSSGYWMQLFNLKKYKDPNLESEVIVKTEICLFCLLCLSISLCVLFMSAQIANGEIYAVVLIAIFVGLTLLVLLSIATQPKSPKELSFKVPLVPLIPALSILINIYLMVMLDPATWIRFGIWMVVGIPTYYFSVKTKSTRNGSLSSLPLSKSIGKANGISSTNTITSDDLVLTVKPVKRAAPPPPTIEDTIKDLDEILEKEEAAIERRASLDSMSNVSNVRCEENVEADVHCISTPITSPLPNPHPIDTEQSTVETAEQDQIEEFDTTKEKSEILEEATPKEEPEIMEETTEEPLEVLKEEEEAEILKEKELDVLPEETPEIPDSDERTIPPPPPPLNRLSIPRPQFTLSGLADVKLKPISRPPPPTPPVDYSRQNSMLSKDDGNLKFGTAELKEFAEKLDKKLQQEGYAPQVIVPSRSSKIAAVDDLPASGDVDDHNIDRDDAKIKLAQFLARTNSLPSEVVKSTGKKFEKQEVDLESFKEDHRNNMENIFKSVRLRKKESFNDDLDGQTREN